MTNIKDQNWKQGNHQSMVVSDTPVINTNFPAGSYRPESEDAQVEHYGGFLVCEGIPTPEIANLIASSPKMLRTLEANHEMLLSCYSRLSESGFHEPFLEDLRQQMTDTLKTIKKATQK